MKLLLCDNKRIKTYELNSVEDSLIIDYYYNNSDIYETITLKRLENSWSVVHTNNIEILNKKESYKEYDFVNIHFLSFNSDISLYFVPDVEEFIDLSFMNLSSIKIGSTADSNIIIKSINDNKIYAQILKEGNNLVVKSLIENEYIYVDGFATKESILKMGNVIFVKGLSIIWMRAHIRINNSIGNLALNGLAKYDGKRINEAFTPPTEYERNMKLFSENQVFFHTPRMKATIKNEVISLEEPPSEIKNEQTPFIITMGTSAIFCLTSVMTLINAVRSYKSGGDKTTMIVELATGIVMLIVSLFMPIISEKYQKSKIDEKNKLRLDKYTKYLDEKEEAINKIIRKQEQILLDNNISLEEIERRISSGGNNLWIREIQDDDFLDLRLGLGEINADITINAPEEHFSLYDDDLKNKVINIGKTEKKLSNIPITLSLTKNKIVSFIFNASYKQDYINSIMLQLMYYYSPIDLKIVIFTTEENAKNWDYAKYLPHLWSDKKDRRFFAENDNESIQLSSYLDQIYDKRISEISGKDESDINRQDLYKNYSEYYLIITDNFKEAKNIPIINRLLDSKNNVGFSLLVFENSIKNLPSRLDKFVDIQNNLSAVFSKNLSSNEKCQFKSEYISNLDITAYSKKISNVPIENRTAGYNLPSSINFMELYHAGKISHLSITKKWKENDPTKSLFAPVGVKDNGKLIGIDLHEKVHGPHGLIAGSTGSGKSEFIITYVLSMAINYSPKEVQFILIDYKGGGLAGAFENRSKGIKIPHLVGTITNLDTSEMNRTLVSIQSELKRRQAKFNEAREILGEGTIDIYKYQKMYREGKITEPMSHLFVICDEFAELKSQQPEFMAELISTSRIGRSLGVHLILATQKPSGVVDDQIWSNSRFKVCLKVQTESDSIEMIKRPEAAMIKETGRFYFQVGNNELFEYGQSAWTGAKYVPVEHLRSKIDDSVDFLSNDGLVIKTINEAVKVDSSEQATGEQLVNIVNYLYDLANKENIGFSSLWLPSLPDTIYLADLIKKYDYKAVKNNILAIAGEYDKPTKQEQGLFELDLNSSNTVIFGTPNSGKENLLSNIIYSVSLYHTPYEVVFYILDFGSGALSAYMKFPHVGDYINADNKEKVLGEFNYLAKEIRRRKELFAEYGGSHESYCKNSGKTVPLIVTILNSYESFMENCYDYDDVLSSLLRESSKYGIVFVTTCISTNAIRNTVLDTYETKIILQCNDPYDYRYMLDAPVGLVPAKVFGRGIAIIDEEACEFQSGLVIEDAKFNETIKVIGKKLSDYYQMKADAIKLLPSKITLNSMFKYAKQINRVPIGYTRDSVELYYMDFIANRVTNIIGNSVTDDIEFMGSIIDLIDSIKDVKLNIFDFITCINNDGNASYYSMSFQEPLEEIINQPTEVPTINILIGIGNIYDALDDEEKELFRNIMLNINNLQNQSFIIFDNNDRFNKIVDEEWFESINKNYVWVGKYIDSQNIFDTSNISNYDLDENMSGLVYVMKDQEYVVIKGVMGSDDYE